MPTGARSRVFTGLDVNDVFYVAQPRAEATLFRYDRRGNTLRDRGSVRDAVVASRHQFIYLASGNNFVKIDPYNPATPVGNFS